MSKWKAALVALAVVACSSENEPEPNRPAEPAAVPVTADAMSDSSHAGHDTTATGATAPGAASPMAGMDHSKMEQPKQPTAAGAMPGMDHSKMVQPRKPAGGAAMAGHDMASMKPPSRANAPVDHSRMNMPQSREARVDHSAMPGMAKPAAATQMQHANEASSQSGTDAATEKMRALVRALISDPAVMRQIENNDSLRRAWQNPAVQKTIKGN